MKLCDYTYHASVYFHPSTVRLRSMVAETAVRDAEQDPDSFRGECACIFHRLAYAYPYESFNGLRRYILAVKDKTGLRSRFRGYVAIDFSEWAEHTDESYFQVFLMYLADHADGIHYLLFFGTLDTDRQENIVKVLGRYMTVRKEAHIRFGTSQISRNQIMEGK